MGIEFLQHDEQVLVVAALGLDPQPQAAIACDLGIGFEAVVEGGAAIGGQLSHFAIFGRAGRKPPVRVPCKVMRQGFARRNGIDCTFGCHAVRLARFDPHWRPGQICLNQ